MTRLARPFSPLRLALALTLLVLLCALISAVGNTFHNYQLRRERAQLHRELLTLEQQHEQLVGIESYLRSDEYVETVARRVLGYSRPGESTAIIITPAGPRQGRAIRSPDQAWWESLFDR